MQQYKVNEEVFKLAEGSGRIKIMRDKFEKIKKILEIYKKYLLKIKEIKLKLIGIKSKIIKRLDQKRIEEIRKNQV